MAETNLVEAVLSNTDLLIQILIRIPPKPLITFKIVSKHWLSIISDPHFLVNQTHHHLTTHPSSSLSLFHYQNKSISIRDDEMCIGIFPKLDCLEGLRPNVPFGTELNILSSCNGFILCNYGNVYPYIIFNPTTQKLRLLPEPLGLLNYEEGLGTVLTFDPLKSFHYKVVRFRSFCFPDLSVYIDIFSSESGAWKELHLQDPPGNLICDTRMIFLNGAIHWITSPNLHVSLLVDEEKFTWDRIPTNPDTFPERGDFGYFGKSDNHLVLMKFFSELSDEVFTVIEMDKDNCWSPKHQVDLKPLVPKYPEMSLVLEDGWVRLDYSVLYVKSGNKTGDFRMVIAIPEKTLLYEARKGNGGTDSKVLCELPYSYTSSYHDMHPLVMCLAPVF